MAQVNSDLIRGNIDMLLLKCLENGDDYGYGIIKKIYEKSGNIYELKEPSLYTSLRRLETQEFISSYWGDESHGARRKYYKITDSGKMFLSESINSWNHARNVIESVLKEDNNGRRN